MRTNHVCDVNPEIPKNLGMSCIELNAFQEISWAWNLWNKCQNKFNNSLMMFFQIDKDILLRGSQEILAGFVASCTHFQETHHCYCYWFITFFSNRFCQPFIPSNSLHLWLLRCLWCDLHRKNTKTGDRVRVVILVRSGGSKLTKIRNGNPPKIPGFFRSWCFESSRQNLVKHQLFEDAARVFVRGRSVPVFGCIRVKPDAEDRRWRSKRIIFADHPKLVGGFNPFEKY